MEPRRNDDDSFGKWFYQNVKLKLFVEKPIRARCDDRLAKCAQKYKFLKQNEKLEPRDNDVTKCSISGSYVIQMCFFFLEIWIYQLTSQLRTLFYGYIKLRYGKPRVTFLLYRFDLLHKQVKIRQYNFIKTILGTLSPNPTEAL